MSLSIYLYKVKKGTIPTCKGTEWCGGRRCYNTYEVMKEKCEVISNKRGIKLYKFDLGVVNHLMIQVLNSLNKKLSLDYDEECEEIFLHMLGKRKFNWEKYDYYAIPC